MKKRILSFLMAFFLILPVARAEEVLASGGCGAENESDLAWRLRNTASGCLLTFQGSGAMKDYSTEDGGAYPYNGNQYTARYTQAPWYAYKDMITAVEVPSGVTRIGSNAFYGNPNRPTAPNYRFGALERLSMADSVQSIGDSAFARCTALREIRLSEGLETIEAYAFSGCEALETCEIPQNLSEIQEGAFSDCPNLTLRVYRGSAGERYAQENSLRHTVLGESGTNLASGTCGKDLAWVLREDGTLEFSGNGAMQDYTLITGESYQVSPSGATYRASYTSAPWYQYKDQIRRVSAASGTTSIGANAFCGNIIRDNAPNYRFENLKSLVLAESVEQIGSSAFARCNALEECVFPEGLLRIGDSAFHSCTSLSRVFIPESVTAIGTNAFANCPALTLTVPLGSYAAQWALANQVPYVEVGTAKVEGVSIVPSELEIQVEETSTLRAQIEPANARELGVTWQSLDESIVRVDQNGVIKGVSPGTAQILVITVDGQKTDFCTVTVILAVHPTGVVLDRNRLGLEIGESAVLTAQVLPENASNRTVRWRSSDPSIATVDENGRVTLIAEGEAVISVITEDGDKTAFCTVTSPVAVKGIRLNKTAITLRPGETDILQGAVLPENATNTEIVWTSSRPAVAEVTQTGTVLGKTAGSATIIAISRQGNFTALCLVRVQSDVVNVTGIRLNRDQIPSLKVGTSVALTADVTPDNATNPAVTWSSSNSSVAAVSGNGVVTAAAAGTARITAVTADGDLTAACMVTVTDLSRIPDRLVAEVSEPVTVSLGSPLNLSGVAVRAYYGGESEIVTDYFVSGYQQDKLGRQTITLSYQTCSAALTVTVTEPQPVYLTLARLPDKVEYGIGEKLDLTGLELQAHYENGSFSSMAFQGDSLPDGVECSGFQSDTGGTRTISITFSGLTATFPVSVRIGGSTGSASGVEAPKMSISSFAGGKSVSFSASGDAVIYYTTNGDTPTAASRRYQEPVSLTETATVRAVAVLDGVSSAVTGSRIPVPQTQPPAASHENGAQLPAGTIVTLQSETSGAAIYYTTDGTTPSAASLRYSSGIIVNDSMTVRAVAVKDGYQNSETVSLRYQVPKSQMDKQSDAAISIGSVVSRAGEIVSAPIYILTSGEEKVTDFRFSLRFDRTMFEYASLTPVEGMPKSSLMVSADVSGGVVTVQYSGGGQGAVVSGEMFTLNLNVLASAEDGEYQLDTADEVMSIQTDQGTPLVSVTSGVITLLGSHNSQLSCMITYQNSGQQEISTLDSGETNISATFHVDPYTPETGNTAVMVDVFVAVYDRQGLMVDLECWNVALSNVGTVFMRDIPIPPNVEVGRIKTMILSEDMIPLTAASALEGTV